MVIIVPKAFLLPRVSDDSCMEYIWRLRLGCRQLTFPLPIGNTVCDESEKDEMFKSPLLWSLCATKEEMANMPPTSVVVGEVDMIRDMGIELYHRLKDAGVESLLTIMGGGIHEQQLFANHSPQVTNQSVRDLAGFAQYVADLGNSS